METLKNKTVSEAVADWFVCNERRVSPHTTTQYRRVLGKFLDSLPAKDSLLIEQVERGHIESFFNSLPQSYTTGTINVYIAVVKSFFHWFSDRYDVSNPTAKIKFFKKQPVKARFIAPEEYLKILAVCKPIEKDLIRFLANTGLRSQEIRSLRWDDTRQDLSALTVNGKGLKLRTVPTNSIGREILSKYERRQGELVGFIKPYLSHKNALYYVCKAIAKRCGIPCFGPHALRHYFATELFRRGVPIGHISKILGHASIATTEKIYIHSLPDDFNGETEVLVDKKGEQNGRTETICDKVGVGGDGI